MPSVAIIGAGASGCLCSVLLKELHPEADVVLLEKGGKPLRKVARTGGGRCNLTNTFRDDLPLREIYPRGYALMKRALPVFGWEDTVRWFSDRGVKVKVEEGGRVFPVSDDALQIVRCLENEMRRSGVHLVTDTSVTSVVKNGDGSFSVKTSGGDFNADKVVVCSGGGALQMLDGVPVKTERCVPSLFALRLDAETLGNLAGISCRNCLVSLAGSGLKASGDILVAPWGLTGPGILRLSSYGARTLAENGWKGTLIVNWASIGENGARDFIKAASSSGKLIANFGPEGLADRLWKYLADRAGIRGDMRWCELSPKGASRLAAVVSADSYPIAGRRTSKEEFVTCGGVSLSDVNLKTLESRSCPGMHFAGEALDIDAITGGYNLQAAWSTAAVVAENLL